MLILSVSHGRDHYIHVFPRPSDMSSHSKALPSKTNPAATRPIHSLRTNSLGFCAISWLDLQDDEALVAGVALTDDQTVS
jgi:hypothetical protein